MTGDGEFWVTLNPAPPHCARGRCKAPVATRVTLAYCLSEHDQSDWGRRLDDNDGVCPTCTVPLTTYTVGLCAVCADEARTAMDNATDFQPVA